MEQIKRYILKFGIDSPLILTYNPENGKVYLAEGNHRLAVAMTEGIPYLPVHVTSKWLEPNEFGNFKILTKKIETSRIKTLLPEHLGLTVKQNKLE